MTTGNDSKITDIPLVKTEVVFGWIPAYVRFLGWGRGEVWRVFSAPEDTDRDPSDPRVLFIWWQLFGIL